MQRRYRILDHVEVLVWSHAEEGTCLNHLSEAIAQELRVVGKDVKFHPRYGETSSTKHLIEDKKIQDNTSDPAPSF